MRASLNEIHETEQFLSGQLDNEDALVFEARLLTNPVLRVNVFIQQNIHIAIKIFYRRKIKQRLRAIHADLFTDPEKMEFQKKVLHYF
jgi:anti-sigma factor RsiW